MFDAGDFVTYRGVIWIVARRNDTPGARPSYWLVAANSDTCLWHGEETARGYLDPITSAKPKRARGALLRAKEKFLLQWAQRDTGKESP